MHVYMKMQGKLSSVKISKCHERISFILATIRKHKYIGMNSERMRKTHNQAKQQKFIERQF